MLTEVGRFGDLGVYVLFRLEGTNELLWKAPMQVLPRPGDFIGHLRGADEVTTWYEIEEVRFEFEHAYGDGVDGDGNPVPYVAEREYFGVCAFVSEV